MSSDRDGLPGDDDGLIDADTAEIHLVVPTHGGVHGNNSPTGDTLYQILTTFGGGCIDGDPNDGAFVFQNCADVQFAVFP